MRVCLCFSHGCGFKPRAVCADYRVREELQWGAQRALFMNGFATAHRCVCVNTADRYVKKDCRKSVRVMHRKRREIKERCTCSTIVVLIQWVRVHFILKKKNTDLQYLYNCLNYLNDSWLDICDAETTTKMNQSLPKVPTVCCVTCYVQFYMFWM